MYKKLNRAFELYKKEIKNKQLIVLIVMILFFFVSYSFVSNQTEVLNEIYTLKSRLATTQEMLIVSILFIFSGAIPYIFLPAWGAVMIPASFAISTVEFTGVSIVFAIIVQLIKIIIFSYIIAIGIYVCSLATKRYRYNSSSSFTLDDLKKDIYIKSKNKKKLEELEKKMKVKKEKREKLNVKIPYLDILYLSLIGIIPLVVITLITGV